MSPKKDRVFCISGNNKGLVCPFKSIICQEGYCSECQLYFDWQKSGEMVVMCAWCGKVLRRETVFGKSVVSHGICSECRQKHFPKTLSRKERVQ